MIVKHYHKRDVDDHACKRREWRRSASRCPVALPTAFAHNCRDRTGQSRAWAIPLQYYDGSVPRLFRSVE